MAYCYNCGVELEEGAGACPLCGTKVPGPAPHEGQGQDSPRAQRHILDFEDKERLTSFERGKLAWELLTVCFGLASTVVAVADLLDRPGLAWSLYPLASLALAWILVTAIFRMRPASGGLVAALALPAFLLALDAIDGPLGWSLSMGLPICLAAELLCLLAVLAILRSKRRGANVVAIILTAVAGLCFAIEASVDIATRGRIGLVWSSIVLASLLPVAALLLYLHYRVLGKTSLRRFFHL